MPLGSVRNVPASGTPRRGSALSGEVVARTPRSRDPTGTGPIRRAFRAVIERRLRLLKANVKEALLANNMLGLGGKVPVNTSLTLALFFNTGQSGGSSHLRAFETWFRDAIEHVLIDRNGHWIEDYLRKSYDYGEKTAKVEMGATALQLQSQVIDNLIALCQMELRGAADAMTQNVMRIAAGGLISRWDQRRVNRAILGKIDEIGVSRLRAMANTYIVRSFNEAKLDVYKASGVEQVGTIAETRPPHKGHDHAQVQDARRKKLTPLQQTRIERRERRLSALGLVEVLTAGDDDVCDECEEISDEGPYDIDEARGLIPAHPHCRCAFIPFRESRS